MNEWISKIGMDKVAHFGVGATLSFIITNLFLIQDGLVGKELLWVAFAGVIVTMIAECFKEFIIDDKPDWKDIVATLMGAVLPFLVNGIGVLFYIWSH